MTADHIQQLTTHARRRSEQTQRRARQALAALAGSGQDVTVAVLAKNAGVSRSWVYTQPDLLERVEELRHASARATKTSPPAGRASLESLNRRLELAHMGSKSSRLRTPG
ncbi:MAG: transposase [Austwickia sp.]|nr:transposase [Austwickia sp.]MBK9100948.1 transposase [Austwickia sp.]